jgi:serine-type D-Ala-D-Ala carboxypeptidase/endopeptidase
MVRRRQALVRLGLGAAAAAPAGLRLAHAQPVPALPAMPAMSELAPLLAERVRHEGVGLVALQVSAASPPRFAAAGRTRLDSDAPAPDADTRFEYGSISKTFTALLLAEMVVRGELKLDDAVEAVLPDGLKLRDSAGEPLRFIDLATHRSGLPRLPPNMQPAQPADPYADYGADRLWSALAAWRPSHRRQARFEYSNLGFGLLGEALALRLKTRYSAAVAERVFGPLGLPGLLVRTPGMRVEGLAQGHDGERRPVPPWHFGVLAGAGAVCGSARELARYAQCALGQLAHPLEPAFWLATQRQADGPSAQVGIGLAWLLPAVAGRTLVNHDGGTFGMSSSLFIDPAGGRAAAVLANASVAVQDLALHALDGRTPLRDVAAEVAQRTAMAQRPAAVVPAEALRPLEGVYALTPSFKVTMRVRDGRLFTQATGQGEFELFAVEAGNARRWFARVGPIEIDFEAPDATTGKPPAFELRQAGQKLRAVRE